MKLSHNMHSLHIYNSYQKALADQRTAVNNLSSGTKVNSSMDNPYATSVHDIFTMQLSGAKMASQNAQDGISLLQITDNGLSNMTSSLQRIRELTVQASNDTNTAEDKANIQLEITGLIKGIDGISKSTNMNDISLLNSGSTSIDTMIGANVGEKLIIPAYNFEATNLKDASNNSLSDIDVTTSAGATSALNVVDAAISTISAAQSTYGALQNGLESSVARMSDVTTNTTNADSDVMDSDMATEMTNYTTTNVLVQAGIAMLAQSNKFPTDVLSLLQNVK